MRNEKLFLEGLEEFEDAAMNLHASAVSLVPSVRAEYSVRKEKLEALREGLLKMYMRRDEIEFRRAAGTSICEGCNMPYFRHGYVNTILDSNNEPYLTRLCNGDLVKL